MRVLLPPAAKYGNRTRVGVDARAGHPNRSRPGRLNGRRGSIFFRFRWLIMADAPAPPRHSDDLDPSTVARSARGSLEALLAARPTVIDLPPGSLDRLERFVALLLDANRRLNLTRIVNPDAVAVGHLLDALAALPVLDALAPTRLVDLGSGGGIPAIPLAIARPGWSWTLIEVTRRKAAVLTEFASALDLAGVQVVAERAETVGRDVAHRERYDVATARACAALPTLVELAMPLVRVGGTLVAWKGPLIEGDPEVDRGARAAALVGAGPARLVPTRSAELGGRTLIVMDKAFASPARYPRRPGQPERRPLA
jgi:16S rRNA (guanine527-N7)-methyltransferase